MSKSTRQQAIIEIITNRRIPSQAALAEELKKCGFDVTQATLSRDIAELNLVKSKDAYLRPEDANSSEGVPISDPVGVLRRLVVGLEEVGNLLIVKTHRSSAQQVGMVLDHYAPFTKIAGTVAGDDTVLVILRSLDDALEIKKIVVDLIK